MKEAEDKNKKIQPKQKAAIRLFAISVFVCICIVLVWGMQKFPEIIMRVLGIVSMLTGAYMVFDKLFSNNKVKDKLSALGWWLMIWFFNITLFEDLKSINMLDAVLLMILGIYGLVVSVYNYLIKDDTVEELIHALLIIFVCFMLALIFVEAKGMLFFWIFKVLALIIICSGIKISSHVPRVWGIIIILAFYICMIVVSGILNIELLLDSVDDGWRNFYVAVHNMYSLPDIEEVGDARESAELLVSYVLCRVMDAVLIGGLINIISEKDIGWTEKRTSKEKKKKLK